MARITGSKFEAKVATFESNVRIGSNTNITQTKLWVGVRVSDSDTSDHCQ